MNERSARRLSGLSAVLFVLALPLPALAQSSPPPARSTHARAQDGRDLLLRLDGVLVLVPAGAVTPGAVVGLGTGGVPGGTGVIVTAAGGLHGEAAVLLAPSTDDLAVIAAEGGTPALVDTATGERRACLATVTDGGTSLPSPSIGGGAGSEPQRRGDQSRWIACPVARPGAYLIGGTSDPPSSDPFLADALAHIPESDTSTRPPVWVLVLIVVGAAGLGAAGALLAGGRARSA